MSLAPIIYDYRQREPSKEISGTWPIMRVKALTESARINEAVAAQRPRDSIGGGRWSVDHRYGNPPSFTPLTTGSNFRQDTPAKWIAPQSPPQTAPNMGRIRTGNKWRGGFATNFPPRTASAEPLDGPAPWLHHNYKFMDRFHDTVPPLAHTRLPLSPTPLSYHLPGAPSRWRSTSQSR